MILARKSRSQNDAKAGAEGPAWNGDAGGTVGIKRIQLSRTGGGHAEDLVRDKKSGKKAMEGRGVCGKLLGQGAGHQKVAQVDDCLGKDHFQVRGTGADDAEGSKFTCRSKV